MSLILEALRKSEAERRRGEAPDLRVELPPVATPRPRRLPAWMWIAGLGLVLLAVVIAWPRGRDPDLGSAGTRRLLEPAADGVSTGVDAPLASRPADDPDAAGPADQVFPRIERITPVAPLPAPQETATAPEPGPRTAATTDRPAVTAPAQPADISRAARKPEAAVVPLPAPYPTPDIERITELASTQRQRLPAMKLSMHMWNEDPARRFVVIDGQRKAEGDRVGEATIAAIDRDGVVLDLDGRAVRVPLP